MVATFTHADVEAWMFITCTGTSEGRYPKDAEGDNIGLAVENDFIALIGVAVDESDAQHMLLCKWLCERNYRVWAKNKFFNGDSAGTPGGNVSFSPAYTHTQEMFDDLVAALRGGVTSDSSMEIVEADDPEDADYGLPRF